MNRKQSAVSRRMAERENSTANNAVTDAIGELNEQISNVTNTANSATGLAVLANDKADNILNIINPNSLQSQVNVVVTDLTNLTNTVNNLPTVTGGTGFDPSDPNEPIVYVENFVFQNAGDPDGDGTGPLPFGQGEIALATLNQRNFQIGTAPSEPDHIGVAKLKITNPDTRCSLFLGNTPSSVFVNPLDISTVAFVIKTPDNIAQLTHIYLGLVNDFTSVTKGVYVTKTGSNWVLVTKDGIGTTTTAITNYSANTWFTIIIRRLETSGFQAEINTVSSDEVTTHIPNEDLNVGLSIEYTLDPTPQSLLIDFFSLKIGESETPSGGGSGPSNYVESINGTTNIATLEEGKGIILDTTNNAVTCNINFRFGGMSIPETSTGAASDLVLIQGKGVNAPMELITVNNLLNTAVLATPITNFISGKNFLVSDTSTSAQQIFAPGGSASSTTFLRGDGTWAIPTGGTAVINIDGGEPNTNYGGMNSLDGGNL